MKKIFVGLILLVLTCIIYIAWSYHRNLKYTIFDAKVTLRVVDYDGLPVANAQIDAYFPNQLKGINKGKYCIGKSDDNGMFIAKGKADFCLNYKINKIGYYETYNIYWFKDNKSKGSEQSKWLPWVTRWTPLNPTLNVVLKRKLNPIPMKARSVEFCLPSQEQYYPFDCNIGDWVEPYGTGKKAHIYILLC